MEFANDLLELAKLLANLYPEHPRQANLRRALSTAYYAIFHLLIFEATLNWGRVEQRAQLGRILNHGRMKTASVEMVAALNSNAKRYNSDSPERMAAEHLLYFCNAFVQAQQYRNDADYNTAKEWTTTEVVDQIEEVTKAFHLWSTVRQGATAQAYLVSLFGERR